MGILNIFRDKPKEPSDRFSGGLVGPKSSAELVQTFKRANWLIDNKGIIYGKDTKTGNFHVYRNGKLNTKNAAFLAPGESAREMSTGEYKNRIAIHADTHKTLSQYKTELGEKFDERTQAGKAINALDQEANFVYLNGELVNAWKKDVKGWISEGGVIGWASSFWRKSNLNKAINKIASGDTKNNIPGDPAMAQKIRNSVDMMLREHRAELEALTGSKRDANMIAQILGPVVGVSPDSIVDRIKTDPGYTRRAESAIGTLLSIAISSALGSPDVLLGMIRLPIKARRSPNPNKDIIAYALFGKTYGEIAGTADRETRKYIAGINKQSTAPERGNLNKLSGSLGLDTKMHEIYGGEEIRSSERWYEVIDKIKIRRLKDPNTPVREKLNTINAMVAEKERELGIDKMRGPARDARILELSQKPKYNDKLAALNAALRLRTLYNNTYQVRSVETRESIGDAVKLQKIFNHYNTFRDFSDAYEIPSDPDSARGIRVWFEGGNINGKTYEPRDPEISKYLWYSQETVGVQNMVINGFTAKKLENRGFRKKVEYGPDITRTVNDNVSLANYVETQDAGGMTMADLYARQINAVLKVRVTPRHLVTALRSDAVKVNQLNGFNTGVNTKIIEGVNFHAAAWAFPLEVTLPNGEKGYINLGIKPNCSNLVFAEGIFNEAPIITANTSSWQNLRAAATLRMFLQGSKEGSKKIEKKPDRPQQSKNPGGGKSGNPGEPDVPDVPDVPNPYEATQPGMDGPQLPTTGTLEQGTVKPAINAVIEATPASQTITAPPSLPGGFNLGISGPLK